MTTRCPLCGGKPGQHRPTCLASRKWRTISKICQHGRCVDKATGEGGYCDVHYKEYIAKHGKRPLCNEAGEKHTPVPPHHWTWENAASPIPPQCTPDTHSFLKRMRLRVCRECKRQV